MIYDNILAITHFYNVMQAIENSANYYNFKSTFFILT